LKLCRQSFDCQNDAQTAINLFQKKCKYLHFKDRNIEKVGYFFKKGKPKKEQKPDKYLFYIQATPYLKVLHKQKGDTILNVLGEYSLACLVYNMKRTINIMGHENTMALLHKVA
jgi:hypothetical protein